MNLFLIIFLLLFVSVNWLDFYLTKVALKRGGKELNPVIKTLGLLPVKIGATILFGLAAYFINPFILIPAIIVLSAGCIWNIIQLRKHVD